MPESAANHCDLAVAWTWVYDREFMTAIEDEARIQGVSVRFVTRDTLASTLDNLKRSSLSIACFLDRASDEDDSFLAIQRWLSAHQTDCTILNGHALQSRAADKATMHLEFLSKGINVPYTIIISPYNHKNELELSLTELAHLGRPFIIKPANTTGGGVGVVLGAESLKDVLEARQHHRNDKYLLQETIKPAYLSESRGWFRVLYCCGSLWPCWWDDQTHVYEPVGPEDEEIFGLRPLRSITLQIREVCNLDFFSTEIAYTPKDKFVVVDYVNEICDMRMQSLHRDGVPDSIVRDVASSLVRFAASKRRPA